MHKVLSSEKELLENMELPFPLNTPRIMKCYEKLCFLFKVEQLSEKYILKIQTSYKIYSSLLTYEEAKILVLNRKTKPDQWTIAFKALTYHILTAKKSFIKKENFKYFADVYNELKSDSILFGHMLESSDKDSKFSIERKNIYLKKIPVYLQHLPVLIYRINSIKKSSNDFDLKSSRFHLFDLQYTSISI